MISTTDLSDYNRCKRRLWLSKKAKIRKPNIGTQGRKFRSFVRDIFEQMGSSWEREGIPGRIVGTEVELEHGGLTGRIDFLRKTENGFVIHEERYLEPPAEGVYENDRLELNACAYLAQNCGYAPVMALYVVYDDQKPREMKPETEAIPGLVEEIETFIKITKLLPPAPEEEKCMVCIYYPLCQMLPKTGRMRLPEDEY